MLGTFWQPWSQQLSCYRSSCSCFQRVDRSGTPCPFTEDSYDVITLCKYKQVTFSVSADGAGRSCGVAVKMYILVVCKGSQGVTKNSGPVQKSHICFFCQGHIWRPCVRRCKSKQTKKGNSFLCCDHTESLEDVTDMSFDLKSNDSVLCLGSSLEGEKSLTNSWKLVKCHTANTVYHDAYAR